MSYYERKCLSCGQTVIKGDTVCRACGARLQNNCQYIENEEDTINGVPISDMSLFIDKNSSRYVDIFSKNKDKKIFFNMNWSAFFFNIYWMFYRKMYKYALIFLAVTLAFYLSLMAIVCISIKPYMEEPLKVIEPYQDYIDYVNENGGGYTGAPSGYREAIDEYNAAMSMIRAKMYFRIIFPSICFQLLFGLVADCIYRRYVIKNYRYKTGGVSIGSLIAGVVVFLAFEEFILTPIATYLVTRFLP